MTVKTTYIADDGKVFNTEWECEEYEANLRANEFKDVVFFLDVDGKSLPITRDGFLDAYIMLCKTDEAANYVKREFADLDHPWYNIDPNAGCWYWYKGNWRPADEILKTAGLIKKIMEM